MLVGFLVALLMGSALVSYFVIVLAGLLAGRFFYLRRITQPILPFILIIVGFLFGFTLGAVWASRLLVLVFFLVSSFVSYYLPRQGDLCFFKTSCKEGLRLSYLLSNNVVNNFKNPGDRACRPAPL